MDPAVVSAIATLARSMARRQLLGLILLAVVGGLGVGFAMTAAAGARRADSAYTRLRHESLAPDVMFGADGLDDQIIGQLAALPEVAGIARFGYTPIAPEPLTPGVDAGAFVGLDADFLFRVYRPVVLSGRLPDPDAGDEVVINEALARAAHLVPGQQVQLSSGFGTPVPIGSATVVGIVRGIFDAGVNSGNPSMLLGKAFLEQHRPDIQLGSQPTGIARFADGEADLPDFQRDASAVTGHEFLLFSGGDEAKGTERTLSVQRVGLTILALITGLATLAAVTQAFSRVLDRALADLPILVAIGLQPRQRLGLGALLALPVAIVGAPVATAVSFLASPLIPTGFARAVDPVRGLQLDVFVVSAAIGAWVLALGGVGLALAWRKNGRPRCAAHVGRSHRLLRPLPLRLRLGGEAALVPVRGAGGAASRAAIVTAALSITVVVAVTAFGASLHHLLATDALQGWNFDASIQAEIDLATLRDGLPHLTDDAAIEEVAWIAIVGVSIAGQPAEAYAFDPGGGGIHPTIRSGRPPLADDEIVLGADWLNGSGLAIGDRVVVVGTGGQRSLEIVGSATYPELGPNTDLGSGASFIHATATQLGATEVGAAALIRLAPGASPAALDGYRDPYEVVTPFPSPRVRNLEQIGRLPWLLIAFVSALGMLAVGHGLWASIRARRRDLFVLSSLGFRPRDLRAMLLAQAGCLAFAGAAFGLVAGTIIGQRTWSLVADRTAVVDQFALPVPELIAITAGSFAAASVIGMAAAHWTRRIRTADGLRDI
jgi:ABC-type lipoprotein release transport system permease subunit